MNNRRVQNIQKNDRLAQREPLSKPLLCVTH